MTGRQFLQELCEKIGEHFDSDFFCFCGDNPIAKKEMNSQLGQNEEKAEYILSLFDK